MQKAYIVINEGEIVYASYDEDEARSKCEDLLQASISDEIEESGRDADDLTDEEYGEFVFSNGFNGGHYYCEEVEFKKTKDGEVETSQGDTFTYEEIREAIELSEASDMEDDDYDWEEDDWEDDTSDYEEEYEEDVTIME